MSRGRLGAIQLFAWIGVFAFSTSMSSAEAAEPSGTEFSRTDEQPGTRDESLVVEPASEPAGMEDGSSDSYSRCVDHSPGHPRKPVHEKPGDRNWGEAPPARDCQCGHCRAGCPLCVAHWAKPAVTCRYAGGYVGGGAALGGRCRHPHEGTWGLDYCGWLSPRRVFSQWTCGREQAGEGAYATD